MAENIAPDAFRVEWGKAPDGNFVRSAEAERGISYVCPSCEAPLVLKAGEVRRRHFSHKGGSGCSSESILHQVAKARICLAVQAWRNGAGDVPRLVRRCEFCSQELPQELPSSVRVAVPEVPVGGRVVDVALLDAGGTTLAALEVLVSHAVDERKASDLPIPWGEIPAGEVLEGLCWRLSQDGFRNRAVCGSCRARRDVLKQKAQDCLGRLRYPFPPPHPYRLAFRECWKCARETVVFSWPWAGQWSKRRPPTPLTPTISFERTSVVPQGYWANKCQWCRRVQGDFYLHQPHEAEDLCGCPMCIDYALLNGLRFPARRRSGS